MGESSVVIVTVGSSSYIKSSWQSRVLWSPAKIRF